MSRTRPLALLLVLGALVLAGLVPLASAGPAQARPGGSSRGAAGIGDAYFPLDGNGGYDVQHYSVRDSYDQARDRLAGSTVLEATATQRLTRFDLDLLLDVRSVSVDGRPAAFATRGDHELVVTPAQALHAGQEFRVRVAYAGRPAPLSYLGERTWLTDTRETVAMNQPHMAPWWFASNDHPLDKAGFDIRITARDDRQVIANGTLVRRTRHRDGTATTHWRSPEPMATYLALFALGRYQVRSGVSEGLPYVAAVSREIPRGPRREAMAAMMRSPEVVRWLETQVGPYPFASTGGLTTSLQPGFALENQTRPTYPVLGRDGLLTVVHELAHQWFGDSVSVHGWRDIWLNEGLATFFEARWSEAHGGPSAQSWLEKEYAARLDTDAFWTVQVDDPGAGKIFDAPVYLRGGMATQALRTRIGETAFSTLLHTWVADHRGANGSSPEFEALASAVSGTDLTSFFDAWLRSPTPPAHTAANGFTP